jgi:hypothetical protein
MDENVGLSKMGLGKQAMRVETEWNWLRSCEVVTFRVISVKIWR